MRQALKGLSAGGVSPGQAAGRALQGALQRLCQDLNLSSAVWIGGAQGVGLRCWPNAPRALDQELNAAQLRQLKPGSVHRVSPTLRACQPQLSGGSGFETWIRPNASDVEVAGLRLYSSSPVVLNDRELQTLADDLQAIHDRPRQQSEEQLAESERALGRSAAALTHDLRNQLSLTTLSLEQAIATLPAGVDAQSLAQVLALLRETHLMCSAGARVQVRHSRRSLELREVLGNIILAAKGLHHDPSIRVLLRCPPGLSTGADGALLRRALHNMILNAIQVSVAGGKVRVEARMRSKELQIEVSDEGPGMGEAALERFYTPGKSGQGSTGFGTQSLHDCVAELGAVLDVWTETGRGTRLTLTLPATPPPPEPALLLIDPQPQRRQQRALVLEQAGQEVLQAGTPDEALALLDSTPLRAVLLARGTFGPGLFELQTECRQRRIGSTVVGSGSHSATTLLIAATQAAAVFPET